MEGEVQPEVPTSSDLTDTLIAGVPMVKFKQSRYEDIWPEDVHAAFMEAVALYPPMGKRRLKYYRIATDDGDTTPESARVKSFGRCQLIQSYIFDKTGKNRSRKQVSSHLQRLKKLHKDNPAMRTLFSEPPQPPSDYLVSVRAAVVDTDDSRPLRGTSTSSANSSSVPNASDHPANTCLPDMLPNDALRCFESPMTRDHAFLNFSENALPQEHKVGTVPPLSFTQSLGHRNVSCLKSLTGGPEPNASFNVSSLSTSMRHDAQKIPTTGRQLEQQPLTHSIQTICSPVCQTAHQMLAYDDSDFASMDLPCDYPITPTEQVLQMPTYPSQMMRHEKPRFTDMDRSWTWPGDPDLSYSPLDPSLSRIPSLGGLRSEQSLLTHYGYPETRYDSGYYTPASSESDNSGLPRRLSCAQPFGVPILSYMPSPLSIISGVGISQTVKPPTRENLASPLIIKPTPLYAVSYSHSENTTPEISSMSPF